MEPITLENLPTEMIQKIIYSSISSKDFVNLGFVSREMNYICSLINYPGMTNYKNIKKLRIKSQFKHISLFEVPDQKILEDISPTLLNIDLTNTHHWEYAHIIIPISVITLSSRNCNIEIKDDTDYIVENIILQDVKLKGSIPKSAKMIKLDSPMYDFSDISDIKHLIINNANIKFMGRMALPVRCYLAFLEKLENLKSIETLEFSLSAMHMTCPIPHTDQLGNTKKIKNIVISINGELPNQDGSMVLDFQNNPTIERLYITTQCRLEIVNPPTNLLDYSIKLFSDDDTSNWRNNLNISAKVVSLFSSKYFEYVCDNKVEVIRISGAARAKLSSSVRHYAILTNYEVRIEETKNLKCLEINAPVIRLRINSLDLLSARAQYFVEILESTESAENSPHTKYYISSPNLSYESPRYNMEKKSYDNELGMVMYEKVAKQQITKNKK